MTTYIVKYDRNGCIGASSCTAASEKFTLTSDKADLAGSVEKDGIFELQIDESELEEMKQAAQVCPVQVIKVYDENGTQVS